MNLGRSTFRDSRREIQKSRAVPRLSGLKYPSWISIVQRVCVDRQGRSAVASRRAAKYGIYNENPIEWAQNALLRNQAIGETRLSPPTLPAMNPP